MDTSVTIMPSVPAGTSLAYRGGTLPHGFLVENGGAISRVAYARLFDAIGTTYGVGDGSTTFNLPDSRGRADIGSGTGTGLTARTLAQAGGAETHVLAESEMPSHTHTQNAHNHTQASHSHTTPLYFTGGTVNSTLPINQNSGVAAGNAPSNSATPVINNATATNQNTGGGNAHNNMQPFLVAQKMIKF